MYLPAALLAYLFGQSTTFGQQTTPAAGKPLSIQDSVKLTRPAVLKTNVFGPFSFFVEVPTAPKQSVQLSTQVVNFNFFDNTRFFSLTLDYRFYLNKLLPSARRPAPNGFYVSPYLKFRTVTHEAIGLFYGTLLSTDAYTLYEQMYEYARMLVQFMDISTQDSPNQGPVVRDRYMAENFSRLVSREPADTRVVIWAHNGHICTDSYGGGSFVPIGAYLRRSYGPAYYALGLVYNQGSFQASGTIDVPANRVMRQFTVKPAPAGSAEWYLAQTGIDKFVVDFRAGQANAAIQGWLTTPQPTRNGVGWYFNPASEPFMFRQSATLNKLYDGLLFIENTTRARPNLSVKSDLRGDK